MTKSITVLLILVGVINFYPIVGVFSTDKLQALYGIPVNDDNLSILLKHRAVLFGILGTFIIFSAFRPSIQPLAFIAGLVSMVAFIIIAYAEGNFNHLIKKVVVVDIIASIGLIAAIILYYINSRTS